MASVLTNMDVVPTEIPDITALQPIKRYFSLRCKIVQS